MTGRLPSSLVTTKPKGHWKPAAEPRTSDSRSHTPATSREPSGCVGLTEARAGHREPARASGRGPDRGTREPTRKGAARAPTVSVAGLPRATSTNVASNLQPSTGDTFSVITARGCKPHPLLGRACLVLLRPRLHFTRCNGPLEVFMMFLNFSHALIWLC